MKAVKLFDGGIVVVLIFWAISMFAANANFNKEVNRVRAETKMECQNK